MPYRIFTVNTLLGLMLAFNAQATEIATVNVKPNVQPLAGPATNKASNKSSAVLAVPSPVITEMSASRQVDGSVTVTCREIKNPEAATFYLQNQRQRQHQMQTEIK